MATDVFLGPKSSNTSTSPRVKVSLDLINACTNYNARARSQPTSLAWPTPLFRPGSQLGRKSRTFFAGGMPIGRNCGLEFAPPEFVVGLLSGRPSAVRLVGSDVEVVSRRKERDALCDTGGAAARLLLLLMISFVVILLVLIRLMPICSLVGLSTCR